MFAALTLAVVSWYGLRPGSGGGTEPLVRVSRTSMGTLWTIQAVSHGRPDEAIETVERALGEIARIEALMSEWLPGSPVSQINAAAGGDAVEAPVELIAILRRAVEYGERTEGAFDITWRGMGSVWRFDEGFSVPDADTVEQARRNVDYRSIRIEGNRVRLMRTGMAVGLGGIAKGYAVDRAAAVLREAGIMDSLVAGAGDMLASGTKEGRPWQLGVQDPRGDRGAILGTVDLSGKAISTSGDYERFRIVNGVRYHHIIDPRTGWPARECISVTVAASSAEQSDVLATAIFVLGAERGLELARRSNVDVLIIDGSGNRHATGIFRSMR